MTDELEPWQWPEATWRAKVDRVRAGAPLRPAAWPDGKRCAVALSFDVDHDSNELRDGGRSIGALSRGQYGNRQGVPRILATLARHDVPASFFVPAVVASLYTDEARSFTDLGHEVGLHGWIHERNSALPAEAERDLMLRSADALERLCGARPVGLRTPSWDFSDATLAIARDMGLLYDSSLMADVDCHRLLLDGEDAGVVELPVEWIRDDAVYFNMDRFSALRPYTPPEAVFDVFRREWEAARAEGGLFQLTMHPHVIGYRSRVWILDELLSLMRASGECWFATHEQVVRHALAEG